MYAKITNGELIPAPKRIEKDGYIHYHPSKELYEEYGFLPLVETPYPYSEAEEAELFTEEWQEINGEIVRIWKKYHISDITDGDTP